MSKWPNAITVFLKVYILFPVVWFLAVDTLPLSLFFDGCFAVVAARVDTLLPTSLQAPPQAVAAERVMPPLLQILCRVGYGGCFSAVVLAWADTLPPWSHLFSVDALTP
jgi:hypothetical protein